MSRVGHLYNREKVTWLKRLKQIHRYIVYFKLINTQFILIHNITIGCCSRIRITRIQYSVEISHTKNEIHNTM